MESGERDGRRPFARWCRPWAGGSGGRCCRRSCPRSRKELGISHAMGGVVWGAASLGHRARVAARRGGGGPLRPAARGGPGPRRGCRRRARRGPGPTGPWSLAAAMLVFGAHIGFCAPAIPKALAAHVPAARLARANGVALVGYTLGTAVTVVVAPTVLAPLVGGWRGAMLVAAVAMLRRPPASGGRSCATDASVRDARHARATCSARAQPRACSASPPCTSCSSEATWRCSACCRGRSWRAGCLRRASALAIAAWLTAAAFANYAGPWLSDRHRPPASRARRRRRGGGARARRAWRSRPPSLTVPLLVVAALGGGCVAPAALRAPGGARGRGPGAPGRGAGPAHARRPARGLPAADRRPGARRRAAGLPGGHRRSRRRAPAPPGSCPRPEGDSARRARAVRRPRRLRSHAASHHRPSLVAVAGARRRPALARAPRPQCHGRRRLRVGRVRVERPVRPGDDRRHATRAAPAPARGERRRRAVRRARPARRAPAGERRRRWLRCRTTTASSRAPRSRCWRASTRASSSPRT